MTPELAVKIQLLTQIPEFRSDLEKAASVLGLNGDQIQEVVLRTADSIDLGRIEKQAGPLQWLANPTNRNTLAALLGGGVIGELYNKGQVKDLSQQVATAQDAANASGAGTTLGGLGGGALGAIIGNTLSDGGTLGTGLGAGLGGIGGSLLGNYLGKNMA